MTIQEAIKWTAYVQQSEPWQDRVIEALDIAIEALQKPPISQRSMYQAGYRQAQEDRSSGDLISRAEAIDAITGTLDAIDHVPKWVFDKLTCAINILPSADRPTDGDLISRAEAIEALGEEPPVWCDEEYEIAERDQWRADIEAIKSVPSADRPRGEWISKEELIDAIKDAEFVYDGDEDGHKEHDISEMVRVIFKDIIDNLPSADMRGGTE